jgi:hypothetical protein
MSEPRQLATISSYEDLLALMRSRVPELGLNYAILAARTGFTDTYPTKVLGCGGISRSYDKNGKLRRSTQRGFSPPAFDAFVYALCFDLIAVENPQRVAELRAWLERKSEGRKRTVETPPIGSTPKATWLITPKKSPWMNKRRNEKLSPEKRREIALNAIRTRWERKRDQLASALVLPNGSKAKGGALLDKVKPSSSRDVNS